MGLCRRMSDGNDQIPPGSRVLTLKQPWATLVMDGHKPIENRGWKVNYRGDLWIHAGVGVDQEGLEDALSGPLVAGRELPRGVVLGRVRLVDMVQDADSPWAIPGQWHWVMADPRPLETPIPAAGMPGLWTWPPSRRVSAG